MQILLYLVGVVLFILAGVAAVRRGTAMAAMFASFDAAAALAGYAWPGLVAL